MYITVVDIIKFFFHFLIYLAYRNCFTIISYCKLKRFKVALISYRNSLIHTQCFINCILKNYNIYCRVFIDNIIIFFNNFDNYCCYLEIILVFFNKRNISIFFSKFYIRYLLVELFSFYIDSFRFFTIKEYTETFRKLLFLGNLKILEIYLSVTGFL